MEIVKVFTAGSVDDGKSTLIGRLLLDSNSISTDVLHVLSKSKDNNSIDLAYLTDGLRAERSLGITIDVAYKFFTTSKRKFILVDTPGHREYTRNMFTGASVCQIAILLVDVTKELTEQTEKHIEIIGLLGIQHVIFAFNKMDVLEYNENSFLVCKGKVEILSKQYIHNADLHYIPISALTGEGVVTPSKKMKNWGGAPILEILENIEIINQQEEDPLVIEVEGVLEACYIYGKVLSGSFNGSNEILHKNNSIPIKRKYVNGAVADAFTVNDEVCIQTQKKHDLKRGDRMHVATNPISVNSFLADVCWMSDEQANSEIEYLMQRGSWQGKVNLKIANNGLSLNQIKQVELQSIAPITCYSHLLNSQKETFILVDTRTFATVGAGIITKLNV